MKNIRFIIGILLLGVAMSMSAAKKFTLVIDAGHGGPFGTVIVKDGVSGKRISTISYGKERPLVQGTGEKVWKWNRNATTTVK